MREDSIEDGETKSGSTPLGKGAWKLQNVPWVWRQMLQWQRWTGRGSAEVGTVMVKCTDLQWHCAVSVLYAAGS